MDKNFNQKYPQEINELQQYLPQIEIIKAKLQALKEFDVNKELFYAKSHQYELKPVLSLAEITELEKTLNATLPNDFKAFLYYLGNGGAGLGYGIFSSEKLLSSSDWYFDSAIEKMAIPSKFDENLTEEKWDNTIYPYLFCEELESLGTFTPAEIDNLHEERLGEFYSGFLYICTEGCSSDWALILSGKYAGRVVYARSDYSKPILALQKNFLDWYENWFEHAYKALDSLKQLKLKNKSQ